MPLVDLAIEMVWNYVKLDSFILELDWDLD